MKKLTITNNDNSKIEVDLVRYFKFKKDNFLIYSLGEVDEKNYNKFYLVRIDEKYGFPVAYTFKYDSEWLSMQLTMKKVLNELKKGTKKQIVDLDYNEIDGIKIINTRFFKLDSKLSILLASNYIFDTNPSLSDMDYSVSNENDELEPIDQTMMRENIVGLDLFAPNSEIMDNIQNSYSNTTSSFATIRSVEKNVSPTELPAKPSICEEDLFENKDINHTDDVDYKKMCEVLKKDNEATNKLLDAVMTELNKYKEKYGDL